MYVYAKSRVAEALGHIDIKKDAKFSEKATEASEEAVRSDRNGGEAVGNGATTTGTGSITSIPRPQSDGGFQHGVFEVGRRVVVEGDSKSGEEAAIREVKLDDTDGGPEENILLEGGPKYIDEVDMGGELHAVDMAVLLALCLDVSNSNPAVCDAFLSAARHVSLCIYVGIIFSSTSVLLCFYTFWIPLGWPDHRRDDALHHPSARGSKELDGPLHCSLGTLLAGVREAADRR
jgi:hypothetical protein